MSVLIKGMEMPKNGEITIIAFASDGNGKNTMAVILDSSGTPIKHKGIIEVPTPHGRLIDADAYIDKHEECGWLDDITVDEFNVITSTIIEAEVSE